MLTCSYASERETWHVITTSIGPIVFIKNQKG